MDIGDSYAYPRKMRRTRAREPRSQGHPPVPDKSHAQLLRTALDAVQKKLPLRPLLLPAERARLHGVSISVTTDMVASAAQIADAGDGHIGGMPIDTAELRALLAWDCECAGVLAFLEQLQQRLRDDLTARWADAADVVLGAYARLRREEEATGKSTMELQELREYRPRPRRRRGAPEGTREITGGAKTVLLPVTVPRD